MKRLLPPLTAIVAIIAVGVVHGFWTDRWGISEKLNAAAQRIDNVPTQVGDWEAKPLSIKPAGQAGIARQYFSRYVNKRTGNEVSIMLVCGRSGPVCIHTPEVCYGASGYAVGGKTSVDVKYQGGEGKFFTADALKTRETERTKLRIFWAWFVDGKWTIANQPRQEFAGEAAVYKFYVIRDMQTPTELEMDPCLDFLRQFLPALNQALTPEVQS